MRKQRNLSCISRLLTLVLFQVMAISLFAQNNFWTDIAPSRLTARKADDLTPSRFRALELNGNALLNFLSTTPLESKVPTRNSSSLITLPMPDGSRMNFRVVESPIMQPALAKKYPNIKTYAGQGLEDPSATVRFDWTEWGFHALVIRKDGMVFIEPYNRGNINQYMVYHQNDLPLPVNAKFCALQSEVNQLTESGPQFLARSGNQLRTYRMAVAATGEYTALNGGTVPLALAAITTVINQVDAIYESEVSVRFVLVANDDQVIYTDASTDPYTNTSGNPCSTNIRSENQGAVDAQVGNGNYDIGHVFTGTNIGGCAAIGVVCGGSKGWGASGVRTGSAFDIGLASHEMGHQFNATHTFNSDNGACSGAQYSSGSAYEPGSGTTIMSYAGSCHDLQGFRDMFFHTDSYDRIVAYTTTGGGNGCPTTSATGNTPPNVNAGPSGFIIPISTPFKLTGSGNDPDGDPITFSWEEFDLGPQGDPQAPSGDAPLFRSFPPVSSPSRTFPKLSDILNNTQTLGELLPSYGRNLNFRLTARDNRSGGGGVDHASMSMTVDGGSGPFRVTAPNSFVNWCPGPHQVTWDVANTNNAPINTANVNILLSTDGGNTFPITLASNTPNDGSEMVTIPCTKTTQGRIKVEAVGNVYFDISDANITTGDNTFPTFTAPPSLVIFKDANCNYNVSTTVTGDVTDEADNCSTGLNATFSDVTTAGSCVGETIITRTWRLVDGCSNVTSHNQTITIRDNTPPTFTAPANTTIFVDASCNYNAAPSITGDVTDEADNCDPTLDATYSDAVANGSCIGEKIITRTWSLSDDCGNSVSHIQTILVKDNLPPVISGAAPSPVTLWPPNHTMRNVVIAYTAVDNCSPVTNVLTVTSNEAVNGLGDGDTAPDWEVVNDHLVRLRAERAGPKNGRIYTITITSTDNCGNSSSKQVQVSVEHDQGRASGDEMTIRPKLAGLELTVAPNPSSASFRATVSAKGSGMIMLQVLDNTGRIVEMKQAAPGSVIEFGRSLRPGSYVVKVLQGSEVLTSKIVKTGK